MARFRLQTKTGTTPPIFEHEYIQNAITEAKRLHELHNTEVLILKVVGCVKHEEVPVTRKETKVFIYNDEDLPF